MSTKNNDSDNLNASKGVSPSESKGFKFNWGVGIVIAFALFMTFILYFVFEVQSNSKYDNDLVVEEYYKHDALFGKEMVRVQNAEDLAQKPVITTTPDGVSIAFPSRYVPNKIKGNAAFYRSSNKKFDFNVPLTLSDSVLNIPKKKLLSGRWEINMEWQYEGKQYLTKETIYIN
jgi:hypothetical protein